MINSTSNGPSKTRLKYGHLVWLIILAAAFAIRFVGLDKRPCWYDESCTFYAATKYMDWPGDGPEIRRELAHHPYFAALAVWVRWFGDSIGSLRGFSALCGSLTVPLIGLLAHRLCGRRAGIIAGLLAALHPLHIYYSQEARVYTMWMLVMTVCLLTLVEASRRKVWWVGYVLTATLATLIHYHTLFWLPASAAVFLLSHDAKRFFRQWAAAHVVLAVVLVPVFFLLVMPMTSGGPRTWLRDVWENYPSVVAVVHSFWAMLPSGAYPPYLSHLSASQEALSFRAGSVVAAVSKWGCIIVIGSACLRHLSQRAGRYDGSYSGETDDSFSPLQGDTAPARPDASLAIAFLVLVTVSPLLLMAAFSLVVRPAYVVARYDLSCWPAIVVLTSILLSGRATRTHTFGAFQWIALAACAACSILTIAGARSVDPDRSNVERAERIARHVDDKDLVVSVAMYRWFMTYEWHRLGLAPEVVSFPRRHDAQLCWDDPASEQRELDVARADAVFVVERVQRALKRNRKVWLLAQGDPAGPRWAVDSLLFARLINEGIDVLPVDEWTGLAELRQVGAD